MTPDLMPGRTNVRRADVTLRFPANLKASLHAHPLFGTPKEKKEGGLRVLEFSLRDKLVRRIEPGASYSEQSVSVIWSTGTYADVARSMTESIARLRSDDPESRAVLKKAVLGAKTDAEKLDALVKLSGDRIKQAGGGALLPTVTGVSFGTQVETLRRTLATREGSRTWLIARGLEEAGVPHEIVAVERIPYPADFPPSPYRFTHPLLVVHGKEGDTWVDADVMGPPLPPGRISPELYGRFALDKTGNVRKLPSLETSGDRDEVDIRLTVDASGNAQGSLTVLLRGRAAQEISEAFTRIVGNEREQALRSVALAWLPSASIDSVQLSSREGSWEVALRADATIGSYAEPTKTGKAVSWSLPGLSPVRVMYPRPYTSTLLSTYASKGARENALVIGRAMNYRVRRRVELPEGTSVAKLPGPMNVKDEIVASRTSQVAGRALVDEFSLSLPTTTIAPEDYEKFVAAMRKIDDAFLSEVRVKKD
jgi:hypothetical protein